MCIFSRKKSPTFQKLRFRLLRTWGFASESLSFVLLFPITTSTFCLFMCTLRLMEVVLRCQNQDALRSALCGPATSQNNAGFRPPLSPRSVFRQVVGMVIARIEA